MKKRMLKILLAAALCLAGCSDGFEPITIGKDTGSAVHAVWVSYLDFQQILRGLSQEQYTENVHDMMENLASLGINRIYAHASAFTDAFYPSSYYPWSADVTGTLGKDPGFDPLKILVEEADMQNIEVEAWINPLRSLTTGEMETLDSSYILRQWYMDEEKRETHFLIVNGRCYLNPGEQEVTDLVTNVARELASNYSLAGIHIDDYFYPSGITEEMDQATYDAYLEENPGTDRGDYRRAMSDRLVQSLYQAVHETDGMEFSISPNANFTTNYESNYCDVEKWFTSRGYCDTMIPQAYFGFENETMPFAEIVDQWEALCNGRVKLIVGLSAYKVGTEDPYAGTGRMEWVENTDVLERQVKYLQSQKYYYGEAFFRYALMFCPDDSVREQMRMELTNVSSVLSE